MIGIFKLAFYKSIGNNTLTWQELENVILDVKIAVNDRPLGYMEDDIQLPVLTQNSMLHLNPTHVPELKANDKEEVDLRKTC